MYLLVLLFGVFVLGPVLASAIGILPTMLVCASIALIGYSLTEIDNRAAARRAFWNLGRQHSNRKSRTWDGSSTSDLETRRP